MILIREIGLRLVKPGKSLMFALFECPVCGKHVEKQEYFGQRQESCSLACANRRRALSKSAATEKKKQILYSCNSCGSYLSHKGEQCKRCHNGKAVQVFPVPEIKVKRIGVNKRNVKFNNGGRL